MLIRCKFCHALIDYTPVGRELKRKRCEECNRIFQVKEQDIVIRERTPIQTDPNRFLIKQIRDWMESESRVTTTTQVRNVFHLGKVKAWRIMEKMAEYTIVRKIRPGSYALFNSYIADQIETRDELPVYAEWHSIKVKAMVVHKADNLRIKRILQERNIRFSSTNMGGNWEKLFVYPGLPEWDCIEINKNTVMLNFNGVIRTHNPLASVDDIESHDLITAITFLASIGVAIDDTISDIYGHWAFLGQKLTREELRMYENIWTDESTGEPEIETDNINVAQELITAIHIISKVEKYLKFRFMDRNRYLFYKLKKQFKNKQISMMQYIRGVQLLETYQMFGTIYEFRRQHIPIMQRRR